MALKRFELYVKREKLELARVERSEALDSRLFTVEELLIEL